MDASDIIALTAILMVACTDNNGKNTCKGLEQTNHKKSTSKHKTVSFEEFDRNLTKKLAELEAKKRKNSVPDDSGWEDVNDPSQN